MAVPFPNIFDIIGPVLQPILLVVALYVAIKIGVPIVNRLRQRAYEQAGTAEAVSLVIHLPPDSRRIPSCRSS